MLRRIAGPFREFGFFAGLLYAIDRVLSGLSPRLHLYVYEFMVQRVTDTPLVPGRSMKQFEIREIKAGDPELALMPVRTDVMQARMAQDASCLGAYKNGALIGYMWFCARAYDEDEVRCTYVLDSVRESVFDFDFYLFPAHRMGLGFVNLWNGANEFLNRRGIQYTYSRMTRFNAASRRAHLRLGARVIGRALFLQMWQVEVMLATLFPYVHLSVGRGGRARLVLRSGTRDA